MAFGTNIDVGGVWMLWQGLSSVMNGAVLEGAVLFSYLCVPATEV